MDQLFLTTTNFFFWGEGRLLRRLSIANDSLGENSAVTLNFLVLLPYSSEQSYFGLPSEICCVLPGKLQGNCQDSVFPTLSPAATFLHSLGWNHESTFFYRFDIWVMGERCWWEPKKEIGYFILKYKKEVVYLVEML